jgi:hypothetical protein
MNKSAVLLCTFSAAVLAATAMAYDSDPSYSDDRPARDGRPMYYRGRGDDRTWYGGNLDYDSRELKPAYYVPTQRYYGRGYTVSYRYVPVFRSSGVPAHSSNFRTEAFHIETDDIPNWKANPPRMTVKDKSSKREPVTTIRKTPVTQKTAKPVGGPALAANPTVLPANRAAVDSAIESPVPFPVGASVKR